MLILVDFGNVAMTLKQVFVVATILVVVVTSYLAIRYGFHRKNLVFRTALTEANGDIEGALKRLGPAWVDEQGKLIRLTLNRNIARSGKAIGFPPFQLHNSVLNHVKKIDSIRYLELGLQTWINDRGMKQVAEMDHLECLIMKQTHISTTGLNHLSKAKNLRLLVVSDAKLTEAEARAFEQARPQCEVILWPVDAGPNADALVKQHRKFLSDVATGRLVKAVNSE